jgi:hypothetical protein
MGKKEAAIVEGLQFFSYVMISQPVPACSLCSGVNSRLVISC